MIHGENNFLTDDELVIIVSNLLKLSKYQCLYIKNEHHCGIMASIMVNIKTDKTTKQESKTLKVSKK